MARLWWSPSRAGQPEPGRRLLHGLVVSWKYGQRVRWSRLPPTVARLRSWPEAPCEQRLREERVALAHARVGGEVAVAHGGADAQAVARLGDLGVQPGDVDEPGRPLDAEPHQVDQVGPAAEIARLRPGGRDRGRRVARALVGERPHRAASAIAATMPG